MRQDYAYGANTVINENRPDGAVFLHLQPRNLLFAFTDDIFAD